MVTNLAQLGSQGFRAGARQARDLWPLAAACGPAAEISRGLFCLVTVAWTPLNSSAHAAGACTLPCSGNPHGSGDLAG
jgi:hypothetical protein